MRPFTVTLALLMLAASPGLQGQELVFGVIDGVGGDCHAPNSPCNGASGVMKVFGWVLASSGVKRVIVQIDGQDYKEAIYGSDSADVAEVHPGFPDSFFARFGLNINSTKWANGLHTVSLNVETFAAGGGASGAAIPTKAYHIIGNKEILITNNTFVLVPFGQIEYPHSQAELYGTCERALFGDGVCESRLGENCRNSPFDCNGLQLGAPTLDFCCGDGGGTNGVDCSDPRCSEGSYVCSDERMIRYTPIRGWGMDVDVEIGDAGVQWVEAMVDGVIQANSRTGCVFGLHTGGLSNCYGLPRLDKAREYPDVLDAPHSGYRFVLDIGAMLTNGLVPGHHLLSARAGDKRNQTANLDEKSVVFRCAENVSEPAFGRIESPRPGRVYSGLMTFKGWALDGEGIDRIEVYVDGTFIPGTLYGAGLGTRTLVATEFPGYQDTEAPVWKLSDYDTRTLANGSHHVQVLAVDDEGDSTFIGEVFLNVFNSLE